MIRKANPEDSARIAEIYNYYIENTTVTFETEKVSPKEMRLRMEEISSENPYLVFEEEGRVVGYVYSHKWKSKAAYSRSCETTLYLDPAVKRRGIGSELLKALISECKSMGFHVLIACITGENEESMNFHRKFGFKEASFFHEVGRKFGRWLDVRDFELLID